MKLFLNFVVIVLFLLCTTESIFAKAPYEDFNDARINGNKWFVPTWSNRLEEVKEISGGKFYSKVAALKCNEWGHVLNQQPFSDPNSINSISVKVAILEGGLSGNINMVAPQIEGFFYDDSGGSVWAGLSLAYNGTTYEVSYGVNGSSNSYFGDTFGIEILPNTEYTLRIEYDGNNTFTFWVDGENHEIVGPPRVGVSTSQWKTLATGIWSSDEFCNGYVSATFDDVFINGSSYDDFNAEPLDSTKWNNTPEIVREVRNDKLHMYVQNNGTNSMTSDLYVDDSMKTDYFQVDAYITSETVMNGTPANTHGEARLYGAFHNYKYDGSSGYNQFDGEVYSTTRIRRYADGSMKAFASVWTCDDADCIAYTDLFFKDFKCDVALDTPVVLKIKKTDNSSIMMGCNNEWITYTFTMPVYDSYTRERRLRTRLYSTAGESGYLYTIFDNVYNTAPFPWASFLVPALNAPKEQ